MVTAPPKQDCSCFSGEPPSAIQFSHASMSKYLRDRVTVVTLHYLWKHIGQQINSSVTERSIITYCSQSVILHLWYDATAQLLADGVPIHAFFHSGSKNVKDICINYSNKAQKPGELQIFAHLPRWKYDKTLNLRHETHEDDLARLERETESSSFAPVEPIANIPCSMTSWLEADVSKSADSLCLDDHGVDDHSKLSSSDLFTPISKSFGTLRNESPPESLTSLPTHPPRRPCPVMPRQSLHPHLRIQEFHLFP